MSKFPPIAFVYYFIKLNIIKFIILAAVAIVFVQLNSLPLTYKKVFVQTKKINPALYYGQTSDKEWESISGYIYKDAKSNTFHYSYSIVKIVFNSILFIFLIVFFVVAEDQGLREHSKGWEFHKVMYLIYSHKLDVYDYTEWNGNTTFIYSMKGEYCNYGHVNSEEEKLKAFYNYYSLRPMPKFNDVKNNRLKYINSLIDG